MKRKAYEVICPYDKTHRLPVVFTFEEGKEGVESTFETYCPFCDKYVRASVEGEIKTNEVVLRRYGFDKD